MQTYELDYVRLVQKILDQGELRETRNARTKSLFGETITVDMSSGNLFPLLHGRQLYYKGVFGELAAMLRGPKHIDDFREQGCNYWDTWAKEDGSINVDYGNAWLDFNGHNQLEDLRRTLLVNPTDRRMIVSGWRPDKLGELDLPCCHLLYQWYVRDGEYLDMMWYQRSVDTMIGLPSDVIFAAAWNMMIAHDVGLRPGRITFVLGDTHIYEPHFESAEKYIEQAKEYWTVEGRIGASAHLVCPFEKPFTEFIPTDIKIMGYAPLKPLKMELLA